MPLPLLLALAACDPSANGRAAGPLESWFRGPGPDEYLLALAAREQGFTRRDGAAADTAWEAWLVEGRPLRVVQRVPGADRVQRFTYYGDARLAQVAVTRVRDDAPTDSLVLTIDFAGDTVWRVRWRGAAALAATADTTAWPPDELARLEASARARLASLDALLDAERRAQRSADSAGVMDSLRALERARAGGADGNGDGNADGNADGGAADAPRGSSPLSPPTP